jgi:hypothetical protein
VQLGGDAPLELLERLGGAGGRGPEAEHDETADEGDEEPARADRRAHETNL